MLNIYTVNLATGEVDRRTSQADCRGVGENEIVTPWELTIEEIRSYCNAQWAAPVGGDYDYLHYTKARD